VKNATHVAKGNVEEVAGKVAGDERLESDGNVDRAAGTIKRASEKVMDAVRE